MAITSLRRFGELPDVEHQDSKTTPVNADLLLIEDSADNYAKKKILVSSLSATGVGDVDGPASAVDSNIAEFDGITGKLIKDGLITHANAADAVSKKHTQGTDQALDTGGANEISAANAKAAYTHSGLVAGNPHVVTKTEVGLGNCDNTSDVNKPISSATQTALNAKMAGAASSIDNAIVRFDGTDGKVAQGYTSGSPTIDDTGNLTMLGYINYNEYDTIYVDAGAMIPCTTNGALSGTKEYGTNDIDIDYFAFGGGATEQRVQFKLEMPKNWSLGTLKAKFLWSSDTGSTANDTVEWGIKAGALSDNDTIDTTLGTAQVITDTLLADNGTKLQKTAATPAITVGGTPAAGDMVVFEVYRNTDGTDDMAEDAWLMGVTIQYLRNGYVAPW